MPPHIPDVSLSPAHTHTHKVDAGSEQAGLSGLNNDLMSRTFKLSL